MTKQYSTASEAMSAAWKLSELTGRRVYRHQFTNESNVTRWVVSLSNDAVEALQELTAQ